MNRVLRVSGLIWLMLLAMACNPPARAQIGTVSPEASSAPHTVRGTVVNSVTGEPIYRALVQIGGHYAALTDHEGHFEFEGVTLSGLPPWAMKPGYFFPDRLNRFAVAATDNANASSETELVVKLVPEAVISGTVTGQDGTTQVVGYIAVQNFNNDNGLVDDGGGLYSYQAAAGTNEFFTGGDAGAGTIQTGVLEASNTDLSTEFANMIIAQRGFEAAARVISVSDNMLQTVTDLKTQ